MEHRNSTVLANTRSFAENRLGILGTVAHEFVHAWSIERIRPASLEPFDFEAANMSRELWFGEGFPRPLERANAGAGSAAGGVAQGVVLSGAGASALRLPDESPQAGREAYGTSATDLGRPGHTSVLHRVQRTKAPTSGARNLDSLEETMRIETVHTRVPAPAPDVFDYLADVGNLAEWATEFIKEAERDGDRIRAETMMGEVVMTTRANADDGVVDIVVEANAGPPVAFPTRVLPLPDGTSAYGFTLVQQPGQREADFESDLESLGRELDNIRRRFE